MITNLLLLLFFMLGPFALGAALWAVGKPENRWRVISRFSLLTLMLVMIPLGITFALFRTAWMMGEDGRNIVLICLCRIVPWLLPILWLIYYAVDEWRIAPSKTRKVLPNPNFEFLEGDEQPPRKAGKVAGKKASLVDRIRTPHEAPYMPVNRDYFGLRK